MYRFTAKAITATDKPRSVHVQVCFTVLTHGLLVMGSVAVKVKLMHRMHHLDFQHQWMRTDTTEIGFWVFLAIKLGLSS